MLNGLALQTSLDSRVAGLGDNAVPEWASTHPDPARRVVRAAMRSKSYPASNVRNADAHFAAIDGMLYGDDPDQGVIDGQAFIHPQLKMRFTAPTGFGMQNGNESVSINGRGNIVAIGAPYDEPNGGSNRGAVYVYKYNSATASWSLLGASPISGSNNNGFSNDYFYSFRCIFYFFWIFPFK